MIELLKKEDNFVAIRMSDTIAPGDYEIVIPLLEAMIKEYGKINLYCELDEVDKIDPKAIWEDLKFDMKHLNDFEHLAIVCDRRWLEWMVSFARPFTSAEVQCFLSSQKEMAMNWIESKSVKAAE